MNYFFRTCLSDRNNFQSCRYLYMRGAQLYWKKMLSLFHIIDVMYLFSTINFYLSFHKKYSSQVQFSPNIASENFHSIKSQGAKTQQSNQLGFVQSTSGLNSVNNLTTNTKTGPQLEVVGLKLSFFPTIQRTIKLRSNECISVPHQL